MTAVAALVDELIERVRVLDELAPRVDAGDTEALSEATTAASAAGQTLLRVTDELLRRSGVTPLPDEPPRWLDGGSGPGWTPDDQ